MISSLGMLSNAVTDFTEVGAGKGALSVFRVVIAIPKK